MRPRANRALDYAAKYPALARRRQSSAPAKTPDFSRVLLGHDENGQPVYIGETERLEHMHVIGATGSGKTTLLKSMAMQDFCRGRGGLVIDPHGSHPGSLYNELICELNKYGYFDSRRIILIDPNVRSHVVPIHFLARFLDTDISVLADALLEAVGRVWKDEDLHSKPTTRSVLKATFMALAELGLPLTDAKLLYDPHDRSGLRGRVIQLLQNDYARSEIERLHQISLDDRSKRDFRAEIIGPINRLNEFTSSDALSAMLGVVDGPLRSTLSILEGMEQGLIYLVNLQHGAAISEADSALLGALLLRYVFLLASRRTNREPWFVYVDECHRYLTGDVPNILAETRKYGVGAVLAHQFSAQLGRPHDLTYQACFNSCEVQAVFRVKSPEEAQRLAEQVRPLTLERPIAASVRPTVVGHQRVRLGSRASTRSEAITEGEAETIGEMHAHTDMESHSEALGEMSTTMTGAASIEGVADSTGMVLSPPAQLLAPQQAPNASFFQYPLSESIGQVTSRGSSEQSAEGRGRSRMSVESHGEANTHARSRASTLSTAVSRGTAETAGEHEAFEPVYQDLPSAWHSKEHELYFAGEMIRSLPVGRAFVSWRGTTHCITVPPPKRKS